MIDTRARLTAPDVVDLVHRLGFRGADVDGVLRAAGTVAGCGRGLARVEVLVDRLLPRIGDFTFFDVDNPLADDDADAEEFGVGVLPLLALVITAPEVAQFHSSRGVSRDVSWHSLSDLGQQARVHRQTYGEFGLHTYPWMRIAWSGALYWLGRLQFNLQKSDGEWVLSTHIPSTGALTPASVDESFRWARQFFAEHFGDHPTTDFFCSSWLLDPQLATALAPESNMAQFQRRWRLYGEPMRGNADVLFFTFSRRDDVDLDTLPTKTTLQRAIVQRIKSGGQWNVWQGRIPQSSIGPGPAAPDLIGARP